MADALTRAAQIAELRAAIHRSGLSNSAYARDILIRDPRSLRRWLSGKNPIPRAVLDRLSKPS